MSIRFKDFVVSVENSRKSIIKHCKDNNLQIGDNATLEQAVAVSNSIGRTLEYNKIPVQIVDADANLIQEILVDAGSSIDPSQIDGITPPELFNDVAEFDRWVADGPLTDIQYPVRVFPIYKPRVNDYNGERWTTMVVYVNESTGLNISLPLMVSSSVNTSTTTLLVDWGDGGEIESFTVIRNTASTDIVHTYTAVGTYNIKLYSDAPVQKKSGSSDPLLGSSNANQGLIAFISGDNFAGAQYMFNYCGMLKYARLPEKYWHKISLTYVEHVFYGCHRLKTQYFPDASQYPMDDDNKLNDVFTHCANLKYIAYDSKLVGMSSVLATNCPSLELNAMFLQGKTKLGGLISGPSKTKTIIIPQTIDVTTNLSVSKLGTIETIICEQVADGKILYIGSQYAKNIVVPKDYNGTLNLGACYGLTSQSIVSIVNNLKDNTGETAYTITLPRRSLAIMVDSNGAYLGEAVNQGVSIVELATSKNWTVSLAS